MSDHAVLTFGDFELSTRRRTLMRTGRRLRIGSRAMDILLLLAARPGELVTKDEIQERLWPGIFVDEASIRVHLSALRKALGDDGREYVHTVAGRGYILVPPVTRSAEPRRPTPSAAHTQLPLRLERLIGRAAVVESLCGQLFERRFVTVVGPGGIGKTSVALEVAARLAGDFADGVRFVDLATLDDPETAPGALAIALGLPALSEVTPRALAKPLAGKRLLVVLDNCERLAEAAAVVAEALLRSAPGVCVLATSREVLRAEGEWVHRLPPLATPAMAPATPAAAMKFSAVELFVERANAASGGYRLEADDCDVVVEICRRLDGLPLAIELAATTITTLGVRGVASGLDDRLALLTGGKRTAQHRHQTLRAALDWSYDLLRLPERRVLNCLSVIAGRFDLGLACAVAFAPDCGPDEVRGIVDLLSRKSLIATEGAGGVVCYRLLESNRVYAGEKLAASGAADEARRRYAKATLNFFEAADAQWIRVGGDAWLALHAPRLDDARAALEWAFSETGDRSLARALTAALASIWLHLGLARECVSWCRSALADGAIADVHEMRIQHAFGVAHGFTHGNNMGNRPHLAATIEIARRLGDHDFATRGLWGLATIELNDGKLGRAMDYATQLRDAARGEGAEPERLVGDRMIGSALHLQGRHAEARALLDAVAAAYTSPHLRASSTRFQFDQLVLTLGFLAWIAWVQGDVEGSRCHAEAAVTEAGRVDHAGSLGFALDSAITLALLRDDLAGAGAATHRLGEMGSNAGFQVWIARSEILRAIIEVKSGEPARCLPRLRAALPRSVWPLTTYRTPYFLGELAQAEADAGMPEKALATIDDAIGWFGGVDAFWCAPECFRIKAEVLAQCGGDNARREAKALLDRALSVAAAHGATAWERRVRSSLEGNAAAGIEFD